MVGHTAEEIFPNPELNDFHSGNAAAHTTAGLLEDYYAFEWGDALFVVLDPFWFSTGPGHAADNRGRSLGRARCDWLARTHTMSRATFKFVFLHNLVGGETSDSRDGVEASGFFEWADATPTATGRLHSVAPAGGCRSTIWW